MQREINHQVRKKSQVKVKRVLSRTQSLGIGSLSFKFSAAKWSNRTIKLLSLSELFLSFMWDSSSAGCVELSGCPGTRRGVLEPQGCFKEELAV